MIRRWADHYILCKQRIPKDHGRQVQSFVLFGQLRFVFTGDAIWDGENFFLQ